MYQDSEVAGMIVEAGQADEKRQASVNSWAGIQPSPHVRSNTLHTANVRVAHLQRPIANEQSRLQSYFTFAGAANRHNEYVL